MSSPSTAPWSRLIRFRCSTTTCSEIHFGEPILPREDFDLGSFDSNLSTLKARIIEGNPLSPESVVQQSQILEVSEILGPLTPQMVHSVRCIGFNYAAHVNEATTAALPKYPVLFFKGPHSIADHRSDVELPKITQDPPQVDYEVELVVVIGKDCKNVSKEDAMEYVLGYTVGNDVSARTWQVDKTYAGPMPQASYGKGFDTFAPLGPCIVSKDIIDSSSLDIRCKINGEVRQDGNTKDMVFDVPALISFLSQGTTLEAGSVILTGTPAGVGFMMKPPQFLTQGDRVEMWIDGIGTLVHGVRNA